MMETIIRLNRLPPPVIDPSSVHGRDHSHHYSSNQQGEGSNVPGRKPGKEHVDPVVVEAEQVNEGNAEKTLESGG